MSYGLILKSLKNYFDGFLPSFLENTVPNDVDMPYITYSVAYSNEYQDNLIQARIWCKDINGLMTELVNYTNAVLNDVGHGKLLLDSEGNTWIKPGEPLVQFIQDEDPTIKTSFINLNIRIM